jgi:hypothetical protein
MVVNLHVMQRWLQGKFAPPLQRAAMNHRRLAANTEVCQRVAYVPKALGWGTGNIPRWRNNRETMEVSERL